MHPFDPALVEKLPWPAQILIYGVIFIATAIAMVSGYRKRSDDEKSLNRAYCGSNTWNDLRQINETLAEISHRCGELEKLVAQQAEMDSKVVDAAEAIFAHLREEASYRRGWRDGERRRE